jgi:hypothetical protein
MRRDPYVERWFKGEPAEPMLRRVREIILWADTRMGEYLKSGTVQFACNGDMASFVHHDRKTVTLMFNRGARIKGGFPHLEGDGPSVRFMRFADLREIDERTAELNKVVIAWCEMMAPHPRSNKGGHGNASGLRGGARPRTRTRAPAEG